MALLSLLLNTARIKESRAAHVQARRTGPNLRLPGQDQFTARRRRGSVPSLSGSGHRGRRGRVRRRGRAAAQPRGSDFVGAGEVADSPACSEQVTDDVAGDEWAVGLSGDDQPQLLADEPAVPSPDALPGWIAAAASLGDAHEPFPAARTARLGTWRTGPIPPDGDQNPGTDAPLMHDAHEFRAMWDLRPPHRWVIDLSANNTATKGLPMINTLSLGAG